MQKCVVMRRIPAFLARLFVLSMGWFGPLIHFSASAQSNDPANSFTMSQSDKIAMRRKEVQQQDANLNQTYEKLRARFNEAGKSSLKTMQRSWVTYKESDFAVFSPLAREADDQDRLLAYQADTSEMQTTELLSLAGKPTLSYEEGYPKTAAAADLMLNNIYRECLGMLPAERAAALKRAQAYWIEFRDLYCRFDAAIRSGQSRDLVLCNVPMDRVRQLRQYRVVLLAAKLPVTESAQSPQDEADHPMRDDSTQLDLFRFAN